MSRGKYEKRSLKKSIWSRVRIVISILLIVAALVLAALYFIQQKKLANIQEEVVAEAGTESVNAEAFLKKSYGGTLSFVSAPSHEMLNVPGTYPIEIQWGSKIYSSALRVVDTKAPTGTVQNVTCYGELPDPKSFVSDVQDVTDVTISYKETPDVTVAGDKDVTILLTDTSGNTAELPATLTVIIDKESPVIEGVKPIVVYEGDAVSYRAGISVTDEIDTAPQLNVDSGDVDLSKTGKYKLVYTASDAAGNTTSVETTVEVRERQDWFVEVDVINEKVDEVLAKIIKEGMTKEEQVKAIYRWIQKNCSYANHSDKTDYLQAAYVMLTKHSGDCFNYFSTTKMMFERLGIDNIDVRKVKNHPKDSDHYWSLVSLDEGKTWYHFDATPRINAVNLCLVTDAYLDAYSAANNNCHNRDKSLYPATPEK